MNKATQLEDLQRKLPLIDMGHTSKVLDKIWDAILSLLNLKKKKKSKNERDLSFTEGKGLQRGGMEQVFWKRGKVNTRHSLLESDMASGPDREGGWSVGVRPSLAYGHWYRNYSIPDTNTLH